MINECGCGYKVVGVVVLDHVCLRVLVIVSRMLPLPFP